MRTAIRFERQKKGPPALPNAIQEASLEAEPVCFDLPFDFDYLRSPFLGHLFFYQRRLCKSHHNTRKQGDALRNKCSLKGRGIGKDSACQHSAYLEAELRVLHAPVRV